MDWRYLLKVVPEELGEEDKDALLNTIAWYDCGEDGFNFERSKQLLAIAQEIMKYKSEQVEALLAELDEIARKQGEEEAKRQDSDYDARSMKSKGSGGVDIEDMENKYRDVKLKCKKLQRLLEKTNDENDKLKQNVKMLEKERLHLQSELQSTHHDESASDISETVKDQHRDLIDSVHQKNAQISQLLTDIENIESDNLVLRTKLTNVRDELADATQQLETLNEDNKVMKVKLEELTESLDSLRNENEGLRSHIDEVVDDKKQREAEFEEFASEVDARVEGWKKVLEEKNSQIAELKSQQTKLPSSRSQSTSSLSLKDDRSQLNVLQHALEEREAQISVLQEELLTATKETEETTELMKKLSSERDGYLHKCEKAVMTAKELKKQMKSVHSRCQDLQEDVAYQENLTEMKSAEFQELLDRINSGEQISDKETFTQLHEVKMQKRLKEKQVNDLARTCNKLQNTVNILEKENVTLRERLGLSEDDYVSTRSATSQQRKQKKLIEDLKSEIAGFDEERLEFRLEVQKLSKIISNLSDQVIELGETPNPENIHVKTSAAQKENIPPVPAKRTLVKEQIQKQEETVLDQVDAKVDAISESRYKAVVEENEALRKGLHEILDSVHAKQETSVREIKSETLESLLRALDVKHVSGWYHPAMRLQAELHAIQGSNNELRDQLRSTREQLENYRSKIPQSILDHLEPDMNETSALVIANLNKQLLKVLESHNEEDNSNTTLIEKIDYYKKEFTIIQQQVILLYKQYADEKQELETELHESKRKESQLEEKLAVQDAKLATIREYSNPQTDEELKLKKAADAAAQLTILNRKCVYLENLEAEQRKQMGDLKEDLIECESVTMAKVSKLGEENLILLQKLRGYESGYGSGDCDLIGKLKSRFVCESWEVLDKIDAMVVKERKLLGDIGELHTFKENELNLLTRRVDLLEDEKRELEKKLLEVLQSGYAKLDGGGKPFEPKTLAQLEISENAERQRANHTNNLYELVKEQLQKSEEALKNHQKHNNEIMHKNLILQESVKELENKMMNYIDMDVFKSLESQYLDLLKQKDTLLVDKTNLENELLKAKKCSEMRRLWVDLERQEFLNLRHQIVDLQAEGDDKSVIARLSSDVVNARVIEGEIRRKYEEVQLNLTKCYLEKISSEESFEKERNRLVVVKEGLEKKVRYLENIIRQQRHHYMGYIPLISERHFAENIAEIYKTKKKAYDHLEKAQEIKNDCELLKDTWKAKHCILDELNHLIENREETAKEIEKWYHDKINIQLQELRYKKLVEFKESQLQQSNQRIQNQEGQIANLELELLQSICIRENEADIEKPVRDLKKTTTSIIEITPKEYKTLKNAETQTNYDAVTTRDADLQSKNSEHSFNADLQSVKKTEHSFNGDLQSVKDSERSFNDTAERNAFNVLEEKLKEKSRELEGTLDSVQLLKQRIADLEMNINLLKQQMLDKQSQITFYEKHIMEMQQNKRDHGDDSAIGDSVAEDTVKLQFQSTIKELQKGISEKDSTILQYQSLLKKDRDEHSLAAARFQEEIKNLQAQITTQKENIDNQTQLVEPHPSRAAIEHYIHQVHALEKHTAELHTTVTSLNSQLQSSREEAVRWRSLAYDRLQNMEELRVSIEEQHQSELMAYKHESEKWREEVMSLQQFISKYKKDITNLRPDIEKEIKEKDNKIHELTVTLRQLKNNMRRKPTSQPTSSREENFEEIKENLVREHDVLKKRFEQLLNREKNAREEIRTLKGQLMKRPLLSARSDTSTTKEQQLQKKITTQEKEIEELKAKLEHEAALNDQHKIKVSEDFERWSKQKFWQRNAEKLKVKLKEKSDELEKSQQTCAGYRMLISRLEREKHNAENRLKNLKTNTTTVQSMRHEMLEVENGKLMLEVDKLRARLEMQQRHSGGLGAAMLEDKLEAQERKIAVLEMSAKGGCELRAEIERLQASHAVLQKSNLRLEAENLELRLDLEKSCNELPHLQKQIVHLESYIEVLKTEKQHHEVSSSGDHAPLPTENSKRVVELERTVFVLKRIVEKLQVENKRLQGGSRPCSDRVGSAERVKREYRRLKDQHADCSKRIAELEKELEEKSSSTKDLDDLQAQLRHKSELLEKVKVLLQKAASKEKALLEQVTALKRMIPREDLPE